MLHPQHLGGHSAITAHVAGLPAVVLSQRDHDAPNVVGRDAGRLVLVRLL